MANPPPIKTILETSAFDPEARENPYPKLAMLRRECPVFRDELTKIWFLTRYEDVRATVGDRSLWRFPGLAEEGSFTRQIVAPIEGLHMTATGTAACASCARTSAQSLRPAAGSGPKSKTSMPGGRARKRRRPSAKPAAKATSWPSPANALSRGSD